MSKCCFITNIGHFLSIFFFFCFPFSSIPFYSAYIMHFSAHVQFFSSLCPISVNKEVTIRVTHCLTFCTNEVVKMRYVWATMLLWCLIWHTMPQVRVLPNHWNSIVDWPGRRYSGNITIESWTVRSWRKANNLFSSSTIFWKCVWEKS